MVFLIYSTHRAPIIFAILKLPKHAWMHILAIRKYFSFSYKLIDKSKNIEERDVSVLYFTESKLEALFWENMTYFRREKLSMPTVAHLLVNSVLNFSLSDEVFTKHFWKYNRRVFFHIIFNNLSTNLFCCCFLILPKSFLLLENVEIQSGLQREL